jgi:hypothetical protein
MDWTAFQCVPCLRRRPARFNRSRSIHTILIRLLSEYRSSLLWSMDQLWSTVPATQANGNYTLSDWHCPSDNMTISACWVHYETQKLVLRKRLPLFKINFIHEYFKTKIITKIKIYEFFSYLIYITELRGRNPIALWRTFRFTLVAVRSWPQLLEFSFMRHYSN